MFNYPHCLRQKQFPKKFHLFHNQAPKICSFRQRLFKFLYTSFILLKVLCIICLVIEISRIFLEVVLCLDAQSLFDQISITNPHLSLHCGPGGSERLTYTVVFSPALRNLIPI